jgi:hypothetical protein
VVRYGYRLTHPTITISTAELVFFNRRDAAMRVTPVGVAYANVGFPDGLAHQDRGRKGRKRRILASHLGTPYRSTP